MSDINAYTTGSLPGFSPGTPRQNTRFPNRSLKNTPINFPVQQKPNNMKKKYVPAFILALAMGGFCSPVVHAQKRQPAPNVILILSDDEGWGATSVLMDPNVPESKSDFIRTPNLERLAARSVIFSNGYAAHPNCSPTRASIMTGKSPAALHLTDIIERHKGTLYEGNKLVPAAHINGLPDEVITIAEMIRDQRPEYGTAHFGKWHLGNGGPAKHGFDESDGPTGNGAGNRNIKDNPKDIYGITSRGIKWMQEQVSAHKPFYLQLSHYATHEGIESKPETIEKVKKRKPGKRHNHVRFAGMSEDLDDGVGRVLKAVEDLGIGNNTYIIYLSDNGSQTFNTPGNINGPLHGWKATPWEGGVRVPFFISGPGIQHAYSKEAAVSYDLYPTICDWLGIKKLPAGIEGGSLVHALEQPAKTHTVKRANNFIVFHFPHYQLQKGSQPATTIMEGPYKLIRFYEDNSIFLFDLSRDLSESVNIAGKHPALVEKMKRDLENYLTGVGAALPTVNKTYDPETDPGKKFIANKQRLLHTPYFITD